MHEGPYGKIISSWKRTNSGINYQVTIPANSTATVNLTMIKGVKIILNGKHLANSTFNLDAGTHLIELK